MRSENPGRQTPGGVPAQHVPRNDVAQCLAELLVPEGQLHDVVADHVPVLADEVLEGSRTHKCDVLVAVRTGQERDDEVQSRDSATVHPAADLVPALAGAGRVSRFERPTLFGAAVPPPLILPPAVNHGERLLDRSEVRLPTRESRLRPGSGVPIASDWRAVYRLRFPPHRQPATP